ncbi:MAG: hypothetical protein SFX74_11055 [Fimbriimonadaceae bacterium]|nr:hypothetical protein [Fimbriimonadaceae bacterium]
MPRKKVTPDPDLTAPQAESVEPSTPTPSESSDSAPIAAAAGSSSRPRRSRAKTAEVSEPVPAAEPALESVSEPVATPARRLGVRRPAATPSPSEPAVATLANSIPATPVPTASVATVVTTPVITTPIQPVQPEADDAPGDEFSVSFRPRGGADRPASDRPSSGRPGSGRSASGRSGSNRTESNRTESTTSERSARPRRFVSLDDEPETAAVVPVPVVPVPVETAPPAAAPIDEFGDDILPVTAFRPVAKGRNAAPKPVATAKAGRPAPVETPAPVVPPAQPPVAVSEIVETVEFEIEPGEVITLQWRTKSGIPAPEAEESGDRDGRRGRRRRRGRTGVRADDADVETASDATFDSAGDDAIEPVTVPAVTKRPPIAVPTDAPQVILRDGVPTLVRNFRAYPPLMFIGSLPDARRSEIVREEIRMANDAGVHLHAFRIPLEVSATGLDDAVTQAAFAIDTARAADADTQVLFRIELTAPRDWAKAYPDAAYRQLDGTLAPPSLSDEAYWGEAERLLAQFVERVRQLPEAAHVMGVHLDHSRWYFPDATGYDTSDAARRRFCDWARTRYNGDVVALRASWFDGHVRFDSINVPEYLPEGAEGERFVRSSRKQRRYVDYHLFLSDEIVYRIRQLAYAVKAASEGYFLVGVSYGFTFEWSHAYSGHLALGKLMRTEEVDYVAGPPSYRTREPGGTGAFPAPVDSFALNGKLYLSEDDYRTSLGDMPDFDSTNPVMKTPQALESVQWRSAGAAMAHATGVAWMDTHGHGWLKTPSAWARAQRLIGALLKRPDPLATPPDVAVFIDERSLAYLVDPNAFTLLVQNVREAVLRAGVSAGFYLLSDLAHREVFPESKLYLFLNAWDIRPDLRAAIKTRLQRDKKVLFWLYAAGLFDSGRVALERAREVTGIALKPQPFSSKAGTTITNRRHPLAEAFPDRTLSGNAQLEPSYFAIPEDAVVLGEYTSSGLPSFVVKEVKDETEGEWTSVFLGEPVVNDSLIRALAQMAGAHVWNFHGDVVHVRGPMLTVHCTGTGPRTIALPEKACAYDLVNDNWVAVDVPNVRFHAIDGSTHVFLTGSRSEIEHWLRMSPDTLIPVESIPPRESNERTAIDDFEVPVMRLGEWMSGSDSEESVDEWFLRPEPEVVEVTRAEETPEAVGRRRRRRRGRNGNDRPGDRPPAFADTTAGDPESSLNVMFRKRD